MAGLAEQCERTTGTLYAAVLSDVMDGLGHTAAALTAPEEAYRQSPLLARDPVAFRASFQAAPEVIDRLNAGLAKAGLQLPPAAAEAHGRS